MSNCDLTPVPSCTVSPCVVGAPAPVASTCPTSNLEDPLQRVLALERKDKALTANIRELQRLYNLLLNNTSAGSTSLQGQITALEASMAAAQADIIANTAAIAANTGDIATNAAAIAANSVLIAGQAIDISANAADILTIQNQLAEDSVVQGYVSAAAASAAITSTVYLNVLANATLADSGVGGGNFTVDDTNKRITYIGATTKEFRALVTMSFSTTANGQVASFRWAKNGTTDAQTEVDQKLTAAGTDVQAVTLQGIFSLATNDYLELWGTLDVSAADTITVNFATMTVIDLQTGI